MNHDGQRDDEQVDDKHDDHDSAGPGGDASTATLT